jgi:hypothetical protein
MLAVKDYSNASTRDISVALADFRNVAVTAGLLSFRATQARALSCSPLLPSGRLALPSGSKSRNTRSIGFPSRASKSIGFRRRKNIPNVFSISENRACGMATPSPTPVEPSSSRLDNSASIWRGANRSLAPALLASSRSSFCLSETTTSIATSFTERKSRMFMALMFNIEKRHEPPPDFKSYSGAHNRYPIPVSVWMYFGFSGSSSSFCLSCRT